MHNQHVKYIDRQEANQRLREGVVQSYGTKRRVIGYKLTVSLQRVAGYEYYGRSLVPANFAGCRFIYRLKFATDTVNSFIFRFKQLEVTESPEHALLRMLTPVALEADTYTPRDLATDAERESDPGRLRRQEVAAIFKLGTIEPQQRRNDEPDDEESWRPLWNLHLNSKVPSLRDPRVIAAEAAAKVAADMALVA